MCGLFVVATSCGQPLCEAEMQIFKLDAAGRMPAIDYPNPARLVDGNPRRQTWNLFDSVHGDCSIGIWSCEAGAWRIAFAASKDEFFCVQAGRVRLESATGEQVEVGPGEAAVIPAGFQGIFRVLAPVTKYYVIIERPSSD